MRTFDWRPITLSVLIITAGQYAHDPSIIGACVVGFCASLFCGAWLR